jgi:hypothetical protein
LSLCFAECVFTIFKHSLFPLEHFLYDDECREPHHIVCKRSRSKSTEDFFYKKPFFFLIIKYLLLVDHRATEVAILSVLECTKMICCMALIMLFSIKHYNFDRPTILLTSFGLIENGAGKIALFPVGVLFIRYPLIYNLLLWLTYHNFYTTYEWQYHLLQTFVQLLQNYFLVKVFLIVVEKVVQQLGSLFDDTQNIFL